MSVAGICYARSQLISNGGIFAQKSRISQRTGQSWERRRPRLQPVQTARKPLEELSRRLWFALRAHCGRGRPRSQHSGAPDSWATLFLRTTRPCHFLRPKALRAAIFSVAQKSFRCIPTPTGAPKITAFTRAARSLLTRMSALLGDLT